MLTIQFYSDRNIRPFGSELCFSSVQSWCERILSKDRSINNDKFAWIVDGQNVETESLMEDAVLCMAWFAQNCCRDASFSHGKQAFKMYESAANAYAYIVEQLLPKWKYKSVLRSAFSKTTCAVEYVMCREKMLQILQECSPKIDVGLEARMYGMRSTLALLCYKFGKHFTFNEAMHLSGDALFLHAASLKNKGQFSNAAACFREATRRYTICSSINRNQAMQCSQTCQIGVDFVDYSNVDVSDLFSVQLSS